MYYAFHLCSSQSTAIRFREIKKNKVRLSYRLPGHVIGQNMLEEPQNSIFQEPQKKRKQEGEGIGEKHQQKAGPLFFHIVQKSPAYTTIHIK